MFASLFAALFLAQIAPYLMAPTCPTHDPTAAHGLWDEVRGCHYDHEHGGNPHDLDDVFGTELFTLINGGGPGHPWQTPNENDLKHAGYHWHIVRDAPNGATMPTFRLLIHQHAILDAAVQFHSFVLEALIIDPIDGSRGFIRAMGWVNFGDLHLDGVKVIDVADSEPGRHKQHATNGPNQIWYGATMSTDEPQVRRDGSLLWPRFLSISTSIHNTWGGTDPVSFLSNLFFCDLFGIGTASTRCRLNATTIRPHLISFSGLGNQPIFNAARAILDPDRDGWIDGTFFHDRYGVPQPNGVCTEEGLDCAPYTYQHVRVSGGPACNDREQCGQLFRNYDVLFGNRTSGWNQPVP